MAAGLLLRVRRRAAQAPGHQGPGGVAAVPATVTVELLHADLDVSDDVLAMLVAPLKDAERARAAARRDATDGARLLADLGWRRRLLAERLGCGPDEVTYEVGEHGKPRIAGARLHFSASRSTGTALYAVCATHEVGVDVERIDATRDPRRLAQRLLAPRERALYESLPPGERPAALYACWTRKEAHGKALGTGIVFPLTAIEAWDGQAGPVLIDDVVVAGVTLGPGLAAAVAVLAEPERVHLPSVARPLTLDG